MYKLLVSNIVFGCCVLLACARTSTALADVIDGEELIDPTRPFLIAQSGNNDSVSSDLLRTIAPSSYDLTFVRAGSSTPIATINNQQVTIGDEIGGAVVVEIGRSSVTLLIAGQETQISLFGTSVKTPITER